MLIIMSLKVILVTNILWGSMTTLLTAVVQFRVYSCFIVISRQAALTILFTRRGYLSLAMARRMFHISH